MRDVIFLLEDAIANAETDERKNVFTLRTLNRDLAEVVSGIQDGTHVISKQLLIEAIKREPKNEAQEYIADLIDEKLILANAAQLMWNKGQLKAN